MLPSEVNEMGIVNKLIFFSINKDFLCILPNLCDVQIQLKYLKILITDKSFL